MTWPTQDGTEAITAWLNQGAVYALVLATLMVIGCAAIWAVGSLSSNPTAASRGKSGVAISLIAAFIVGAGFTYVQWTSGTQAVAFEGDPAQYGFDDKPLLPGVWEVVDLSERWTADINAVRSGDGLRTNPTLTSPASLLRTDSVLPLAEERRSPRAVGKRR